LILGLFRSASTRTNIYRTEGVPAQLMAKARGCRPHGTEIADEFRAPVCTRFKYGGPRLNAYDIWIKFAETC
jgi:hypothetical protein